MNELLRANVRAHARRYIATMLAVIISTAFIMIFLALGAGLDAVLKSSAHDIYRGASVEVSPTENFTATSEGGLERFTDAISHVDSVRSVAPETKAMLTLSHEGNRLNQLVSVTRPEPFTNQALTEGKLPTRDDEILLDSSSASTLEVGVGDTITVNPTYFEESPAPKTPVTVSGIFAAGTIQVQTSLMTRDGIEQASAHQTFTPSILVAGTSDDPSMEEQENLASAITKALDAGSQLNVATKDAALEKTLHAMQMGSSQSQAIFLVFPAISILVASIVVATTFQVIMTQRRRELALLRTLGVTRKQVRSVVIREAGLIGVISSLLGVLVGSLAGGVLMSFLFDQPMSQSLLTALSPARMGITWLIGLLMTFIAGIRPALAMARLSPIEALASNELTVTKKRSHRLLVVLSLVVCALACASIAYGLTMRGTSTGFIIAFFSGIVALTAVLVACIVFLPIVAHMIGLLGRGVGGRLAKENTLRSSGRTAATGIAITIGVTLITMMSVGAGSVRATLEGEVNLRRPLDFSVSSTTGSMNDDAVTRVKEVDGIENAAAIRGTQGTVSLQSHTDTSPVFLEGLPDLAPVAHSHVDPILDSQIRVSTVIADSNETLHVCTDAEHCVDLVAVMNSQLPESLVQVSEATLQRLAPDAPVIRVAAKMSDGADVTNVEAGLLKLDPSFTAEGSAGERVQYNNIIDVILSVVIGLLGVSVLVALVGVTNTLSLLVAERTRENGLLRALGMTKRSVRRMLSAEAVFISLAGALIGVGLGIGFGIVGAYALPLEIETTHVEIPWAILGAVIALSVAAALVASLLPGRRAARTAPVEALASE